MSKSVMQIVVKSLMIFSMLISCLLGQESWESVLENYCIVDIVVYDGGLWVATDNSGAFRFDKTNGTQTHYYSGAGYMSQSDDINDMKLINNKMWFATNYGVYQCKLNGTEWTHQLIGSDYFSNWIRDLDAYGDLVWVASFTGLYTYSFSSRTYTSHDISVSAHSGSSYINSLAVTDSLVWIGTEDGLIRYDRSAPIETATTRTYFGEEAIFDGSDNIVCKSICATKGGVWVGLEDYTSANNPDYCIGGLYRLNHGTWSKYDVSTGLPANGVHFITESGDNAYAGLFRYVDGVNFDGAGLLEINLNSSNNSILDSLSWHIGNNQVRSFYCNGPDTLVGTEHGLFFNRDSLFRSPESGVEDLDRSPHADLQQNYPNPFNPVTQIMYSIDHAGPVILDIYDLNGELIRRMISENQSPGDYSYRFNAYDLPAGVYIYRLKTGTLSLSKKMVLLK